MRGEKRAEIFSFARNNAAENALNEKKYKMPIAYTNIIRDYFASLPIVKAWVYGSFSRGEERENSDIDIMVRYTPEGVSLLTHAHIMNTLSDLLGRPVDLVEEDCLLPFAAESAYKDRILVYERKN